jgi:hypothetical protein
MTTFDPNYARIIGYALTIKINTYISWEFLENLRIEVWAKKLE